MKTLNFARFAGSMQDLLCLVISVLEEYNDKGASITKPITRSAPVSL